MAENTKKRLRVVQWATGNIGLRALRMVIEHPELELVGLYVYTDEKAGQDAGELCGLAPAGVKATRSADDILALKPDCILYMPRWNDLDEVCRLLASGANVVTTRGEYINPRLMDPSMRAKVEQACAEGQSSIYCAGSSPGFITELVPLTLTTIARRLDKILIDEYADLSQRDSPGMLFDVMGYGKDPAAFSAAHMAHGLDGFYHSLGLVAEAIGLPFDGFEVSQEVAAARNDIHIAAGTVPKGTIAAHRITISCMRDGKALMQMRLNWYCSADIDADWDLGETGWRVQVAGDTPLDVRIRFPIPMEDYTAVMPGLTAHLPVNAVPYVCAAAPGIRTNTDLPRIIAKLG
jgi:4-hydroxy-tetrahydrodipicolinate reductase